MSSGMAGDSVVLLLKALYEELPPPAEVEEDEDMDGEEGAPAPPVAKRAGADAPAFLDWLAARGLRTVASRLLQLDPSTTHSFAVTVSGSGEVDTELKAVLNGGPVEAVLLRAEDGGAVVTLKRLLKEVADATALRQAAAAKAAALAAARADYAAAVAAAEEEGEEPPPMPAELVAAEEAEAAARAAAGDEDDEDDDGDDSAAGRGAAGAADGIPIVPGDSAAVYASATDFAAERDEAFFFPAPAGEPLSQTLCILKNDVVRDGHVDAIIAELEAAGFVILGRKDCVPRTAAARALYASRASSAFFDVHVNFLCRGPVVALALEARGAVRRLRLLAGPEDASAAADAAPGSLRARFGTDEVSNALHASGSAADAASELAAWFPEPFQLQQTLAIIKPVTADEHGDAIMAEVLAAGFQIVARKRLQLSRARAEAFYVEHEARPFYHALTTYMSSAPCIALVLARAGAIKAWRAALGPTNVASARELAPGSIRARYGLDGTRNAGHGSDSAASAQREIAFFFPELRGKRAIMGGEAAKAYLKSKSATPFSEGVAGTAPVVPQTLHQVVVRGLTELCRVKPSGLEAVEWLGRWLVENNPSAGQSALTAAAASSAARHGASKEEVEALMSPRTAAARAEADSLAAAAAAAGRPVARRKVALPAALAEPEMTVVFVLGGPGSGKGTQCKRIVDAFGYRHLSAGDLLRGEVASGSALGREIAAIMEAGELVRVEVTLALMRKAMRSSGSSRFLIDGFPRSLDQAFEFEKRVGAPASVLFFDCPQDVMEQRLLARGKTSGRVDDNPASIRKRFRTFRETSMPVIDFYAKQGKVHRISAIPSPDEVFQATQAAFTPVVVSVAGPPGAGKTPLLREAADFWGYTYLSVDSLVAAELARGSPDAVFIQDLLRHKQALPLELQLRLFKRAMARAGSAKFLLDGFPQSKAQAFDFERKVAPLSFFVQLDVSEDELLARASRPPAWRRQMRHYLQHTAGELLSFYDKCGMVRRVDGSDASAVAARLNAALQPRIVVVQGPPAAGKSTLTGLLADSLSWTRLDPAELLRAEIVRGSDTGRLIESTLAAGRKVPLDITVAVLKAAARSAPSERLLIDGFPRTLQQLKAFQAALGEPEFVLQLAAHGSEDEGTVPAAARAAYEEETLPVLHHYARLGKLRRLGGDGATAGELAMQARHFFDPEVVFVLGGPGAGKGTQCARIRDEFGFRHLSAGDLLRAEVARGSPDGEMIYSMIKEGKIVPMRVPLRLLKRSMAASGSSRFLIDGFPRAMDQGLAFEESIAEAKFVLFFELTEEEMRRRLLNRGKTSGRADDNEAAIKKRFRTFQMTSMPVVKHFGDMGRLRTISSLPPPDEVYASVRRLFQPQLVLLAGASGSGRRRLATRLGADKGYCLIRPTDLLKAAVAADTLEGRAIAAAFRAGQTAPVDLTLRIIRREMLRLGGHKFVLDGYPRRVSRGFPAVHDQVFALEEALGVPQLLIWLNTTLDARLKRHPDRTRMEIAQDKYEREKLPVVQWMQASGRPIAEVDGDADADAVYSAVCLSLEEHGVTE